MTSAFRRIVVFCRGFNDYCWFGWADGGKKNGSNLCKVLLFKMIVYDGLSLSLRKRWVTLR